MDPLFSQLLDHIIPGVRSRKTLGEMPHQVRGGGYIPAENPSDIDGRIKQLSYSSLLTLHACPKKFQLSRLRYAGSEAADPIKELTFSFGHAVGDSVQAALDLDKSTESIILDLFLKWDSPITLVDTKRKKSLVHAIHALQLFRGMQSAGFLEDWEPLLYNGVPARELSYSIELDHEFKNRGFVDAVLIHKRTKEVRVIEIKTDGAPAVNPAKYKNSSQAVGYSTVLDTICPGTSSYEVLYLVYSTVKQEWLVFPFQKNNLSRAIWLRQLKFDVDHIIEYEREGVYPQHGESCLDFNRECPYIQVCNLDPANLAVPYDKELHKDRTQYQIQLKFDDLIEAQLGKE